jgi:hypothetical protein
VVAVITNHRAVGMHALKIILLGWTTMFSCQWKWIDCGIDVAGEGIVIVGVVGPSVGCVVNDECGATEAENSNGEG